MHSNMVIIRSFETGTCKRCGHLLDINAIDKTTSFCNYCIRELMGGDIDDS